MSSNGLGSTVVAPGAGPAFWCVGDHITFKLRAEQTGGAFTLAETIVPVGGGPPPHIHAREDEMFYVLDGDLEFFSEGRTVPASAGFAIYLPKGGLHTFKNVGPQPARFLVAATPSGFETFIADAGSPCTDPSSPPPVGPAEFGRLMAACARHGLQICLDVKFPESGPAAPPPATKPERAFWVLGEQVKLKLVSADTAGRFSLVEVTTPPGGGAPLHSHRTMDEIFYVLEGAYEFEIDGRRATANAGATLLVAHGLTHGFRNAGSSPARMLDYHTPGGFEKFFEEAGTPYTNLNSPPASMPDRKSMMDLIHRHGMDMPE